MMKPKALIFDVFGTVVDWRTGVATQVERHFKTKSIDFDPWDFADLWRSEYQPAMQRIRTGERGYVALEILHRENLDRILDKTGLSSSFDDKERDILNYVWDHLPPWPDSVPGLQRLKQHFTLAPCSNGSVRMMGELAKFAALPWDTITGAEVALAYKPDPKVYLKSVERLGLLPEQVMMVAAHNDDLEAAGNCGLQTAFFPRPAEHGLGSNRDLKAVSDWTVIARDMNHFADKMLNRG